MTKEAQIMFKKSQLRVGSFRKTYIGHAQFELIRVNSNSSQIFAIVIVQKLSYMYL